MHEAGGAQFDTLSSYYFEYSLRPWTQRPWSFHLSLNVVSPGSLTYCAPWILDLFLAYREGASLAHP